MGLDYKELIVRFLTGVSRKDEEDALRDWLISDKRNEELFLRMYEVWLISGSKSGKAFFDAQPGWNKLQYKIQIAGRERKVKSNKPVIYRYLRMVASWLLIFTLGLSTMYMFKRKTENLYSAPDNLSSSLLEINVPLGSTSHMILPDGSQVWLNSGTRIIYSEDYGEKNRNLSLSGEAYFDVAEDPMRPFSVDIEGIKVRALGTGFNIKAYPEEASISTTLEKGKISISIPKADGSTEDVILLPSENILMLKSDQVQSGKSTNEAYFDNVVIKEYTTTRIIDVKKYISWKDEQWIIERLQLGELATILQRRYNVTVVFNNDDVKQFNFTGAIHNESIEQIMHAISLTAPINYNIIRDTIIVNLNPSAQDAFNQMMIEN